MKTIHVVEKTLPMAWERAVIETWDTGARFPTEYDKPEDANSRDVTAMIHVTEPFSEPRIHRAFPGGLDDLEKYRSEVLYGVHDHWIAPKDGKWEYTYHERIFDYEVPTMGVFNQFDIIAEKLRKAPHTRRAQIVTYQVWKDCLVDDPTCLQRFWFRVEETENGPRLHMNCHIRSNDAFKAGFMNMHAFTELQAMMAMAIGVLPGSYTHMADSFHIYGSYFDEFEGFLKTVSSREPEDRVFDTEFARSYFIDGCNALLAEDDMPADKKALVEARKAELIALG